MAMRSAMVSCTLVWLLATSTHADPPADAEDRAFTAGSQEPQSGDGSSPAPGESPGSEAARELPVYRLPPVGKPRRRVGGGRRGVDTGSVSLYALVPDHVGRTASAQPVLYWVLGGSVRPDLHLELTLSDERSIEPVVEARIDAPRARGLQAVRLADHGVTLDSGVEYQWAIALVTNPDERSRDVVTTGWIERVDDPRGPPAGSAEAADRGLWYDALDLACARAEQSPVCAAALGALLAQVGLDAP
jgi:hypothetical protein